MLDGKRILLIIGGGVAAYKALDLIRRLRDAGADVIVCMTPAAQQFVTPLSAASLSGNDVHVDLFSLTDEAKMGHIQLSRIADAVLVAPATADLLARMAHGLANDLASTLLLATNKPVFVAPAMNVQMWLNPATRRNVARLGQDGVTFIGPLDGPMACGEYGPGRMAEPSDIVSAVAQGLVSSGMAQPLAGKHVLVTSGPTREPIDPVRFLSNHSSGKQGHAIAAAARAAGANVTLVSGPVAIPDPEGVRVVHIETAQQMLKEVQAALPADVFISTAAVADWGVAAPASSKTKKARGAPPPILKLVENPDILATVSKLSFNRPQLVVGFAAETDHVIAHAREKLARKGCDLIVANDVSPAGGVMGGDANQVHIVSIDGVESWPLQSKAAVAGELVQTCAKLLEGQRS
jgi:phosphopantothenoylcysteine decarboxylase / phosphopantothenate---cysteine ligase